MEYGKIRTAAPPKPVDQFGCRFKYITMSTYGVDVQINSAVDAVHKHEKRVWATVCKMVRPMLSGRCLVCPVLSCPVSL